MKCTHFAAPKFVINLLPFSQQLLAQSSLQQTQCQLFLGGRILPIFITLKLTNFAAVAPSITDSLINLPRIAFEMKSKSSVINGTMGLSV